MILTLYLTLVWDHRAVQVQAQALHQADLRRLRPVQVQVLALAQVVVVLVHPLHQV